MDFSSPIHSTNKKYNLFYLLLEAYIWDTCTRVEIFHAMLQRRMSGPRFPPNRHLPNCNHFVQVGKFTDDSLADWWAPVTVL